MCPSLVSDEKLSLKPVALKVNPARSAITFVAQGQGIVSMNVEIFNLAGVKVFSQEATHRQLRWNLRTNTGRLDRSTR